MINMPRVFGFENIDMYESEKYYKDIFSAVADDIRDYRDEKYNPSTNESCKDETLFRVSDNDYSLLNKLVDVERRSICGVVRIITSKLLERNGITVFEPETHTDIVGHKSRFLSYSFLSQYGKRIGVKILWDFDQIHGIKYFLNTIEELRIREEVDEMKIIVLMKASNNNLTDISSTYYYVPDHSIDSSFDLYNRSLHNNGVDYISFVPLETFFIECFGDVEYSLFESAVNEFNRQNESMIGYKTYFMPNSIEVKKFKSERLRELINYDYKKELITLINQLHVEGKISKETYDGLIIKFDSQYELCLRRFKDECRCFVLIGEMSYAESFISSEWYYYSSFETDVLDKTAIAVGYLKSAEQLLYSILRLHINDVKYKIQHGKIDDNKVTQKLKNIDGNYDKYIPFMDIYEKYFNTTFGSLNKFVSYHKDYGLFEKDVCSDWKELIVELLYDYCKSDRNEHLHKDNIYKASAIRDIRKRTWLLYFLLIGSFSISSNKLRTLGGERAFFNLDDIIDLFVDFSKWIDPKLEKCKSDSSIILLNPCYDTNNGGEIMRFAEVQEIEPRVDYLDPNKFQYDEDKFRYFLGDYYSEKKRGGLIKAMLDFYIKKKQRLGENVCSHKYVVFLYGNGYQIIEY